MGVDFIMKYGVTAVALALLSFNTYSGWNANTAHSRANCYGFNESITWNWEEYHWWEVRSFHHKIRGDGPQDHNIIDFMRYTWRSAAYDFFKDPAGQNADWYQVQGYHFYMNDNGAKVYDAYTEARDCSIYDGWWDKNK